MSHALTFYQGSLDAIAANFRAPNARFYDSLLRPFKQMYAGVRGEDIEATLREAMRTIFTSMQNPPRPGPLSVEAAIAAGIVSQGTEVGSLAHSNSGGEPFRDDFLGGVAAEMVGESRLEEYLTRRPLFGFRPKDYPRWGFLLKAELANSGTETPEHIDNPDMRSWLKEFLPILKQARESGQDLLTVYR